MSVDVSYYPRRPARTSQAEPPRRSRQIEVARPRTIEFGRWKRTATTARSISLSAEPCSLPRVLIANWRDGAPTGAITLFVEHVPMILAAIAAARGADAQRLDVGVIEERDHVVKIWARGRSVFLGRVSNAQAHLGSPVELGPREYDALEQAVNELVRRSAP